MCVMLVEVTHHRLWKKLIYIFTHATEKRESKGIPGENIYFCFIDCPKPLTMWIITNGGKLLKRWEYQIILPVSWETYIQVKKQQVEFYMEQWTDSNGKGVWQGCILSPCLFNLYAEHIMWNARLDELQAGIKAARRNINNLRYADYTTLMVESEEELKSLLMKVKEEI